MAGARRRGAFEVLHKEQYTAGFKPTNEKMSFNSEKFPTWASNAQGTVAVDRSVEVASRGGKSTQLKSAGVKIEDIGRGQIGTKELFIADGVAFSVARAVARLDVISTESSRLSTEIAAACLMASMTVSSPLDAWTDGRVIAEK